MVFRLRVSLRVCFRMFPNAIFSAATRSASRAHRLDTVDLELTGPRRDCPLVFDDDLGAPRTWEICMYRVLKFPRLCPRHQSARRQRGRIVFVGKCPALFSRL